MASNRVDWSILGGTAVVFALSLGISAALVSASYYFRQNMEREYVANHARFRQTSQQYLAVDDEARVIDEFLPEFVRLFHSGRLGRERRLSWLEALRRARDSIKLPALTYKLEAQRTAAPDFAIALGQYRLLVSPMNLELGLAHELDLLRLLAALDRDALGQYSVRSCTLKRFDSELHVDARTPNIAAACVLDWWTINLSGTRELEL